MQHKLRQSVIVATAAVLLVDINVRAGGAGAWGQLMAVAQKKPSAAPLKDLYEIGEVPPLGHIPEKM
jgi:hypothetical protein